MTLLGVQTKPHQNVWPQTYMRPKKKLFETPPVSSTTFSTWSPKTKVVNKAKELSKFDNHGTMF